MAQVYVPDDPRVREQLEGGGTTPTHAERPHRAHRTRHFGVIDLVVAW